MKKAAAILSTYLVVYLFGIASILILTYQPGSIQMPQAIQHHTVSELDSPSDWLQQDQIKVYENEVRIDLKDPIWSTFSDTNSMDPILDKDSHGIEILPASPDEIEIGDIISYSKDGIVIIHRVMQKGTDTEGLYFITKGDNNSISDPEKVRWPQITGVLVAIIY